MPSADQMYVAAEQPVWKRSTRPQPNQNPGEPQLLTQPQLMLASHIFIAPAVVPVVFSH